MRRGLSNIFLSALPLVAAGVAGAGVSAEPETPAGVVEDRLIVTATLVEESERLLPASTEVIDAREIDARQATSVGELLSTASGVHVVRSGSPGKVTSLFSRGTESDHTLVLWNGVELNNPFFGGFDWAFMAAEGVERIEIVRGPFSALHGSDALGGAVQILRNQRQGGMVRLEAGDNSYGRGALSMGSTHGRAHVDIAANLRQSDGEVDNDFYRGGELVATVEWNLGRKGRLGVLSRVNDSEVGIPFSAGEASPNRRTAWQEHQLAVPYEVDLGDWRLEAQVATVALDSDFVDPDDAFGFTRSATRSRADRLRSQVFRRFARGERPGGWLAFGIEGERLEVEDRSVFGVNLNGARQETRSAFAQSLLSFGGVRLDLGARFDDADVYGGRLTPKLGVLVALSEVIQVRASYGEGFRAPSLGELFFPFSGNSQLEPEVSENFELGLEARGSVGSLDVVGFSNRLENLIDFDFSTFTNVNVGRARTRGVEMTLALEGDGFWIRANASRLSAKDEITGLPLLRRPKTRAAAVVSSQLGAATVTATATYVGSRDDIDALSFERANNPEYFRLDVAGEWQGFERWRPYGRLENVFDEEYQEALGFPAPGRSLIAGLSLRWQ